MKDANAKKQQSNSTSAAQPSHPFFNPKSAQTGVSSKQTVQRKPFFQPSRMVPHLQTKLTVGAAGDKYEQEADRVAAQVVEQINAPATAEGPAVQRMGAEEEELQIKPMEVLQREAMEEEELQMKPMVQRVGVVGGEVSADFESELNQARGGGQSLEPDLQTQMGQAMGADFSGVRVHPDGQADALNRSVGARAFTTGQDLFFKQGEYQPGSLSGQALIAHELTHVMQQTSGIIQCQFGDIEIDEKLDFGKVEKLWNSKVRPWFEREYIGQFSPGELPYELEDINTELDGGNLQPWESEESLHCFIALVTATREEMRNRGIIEEEEEITNIEWQGADHNMILAKIKRVLEDASHGKIEDLTFDKLFDSYRAKARGQSVTFWIDQKGKVIVTGVWRHVGSKNNEYKCESGRHKGVRKKRK